VRNVNNNAKVDTNTMFELADKLRNLREQKNDTEQTLKSINAEIDETEYRLSEVMAKAEMQNFTRAGKMFYLTTKTRASAASGMKEELFDALKTQGYGSLVTETINSNSLSSFVKEQMGENSDKLPVWLDGLVNVFDKITVAMRKAK